MGIPVAIAEQLADVCRQNQIGGRCLTLGRQGVELADKQFGKILQRMGYGGTTSGKDVNVSVPGHIYERMNKVIAAGEAMNTDPAVRERGLISDKLFFAGLGFSELDALDASDFEGATVVWDLNEPGLGAHLAGKTYDFVFNGGTTEHVFDVRTALRNIFEALSVGGYVYHATPAHNYIDHGFYQFCPTLFYDYYAANGFRLISMKMARHTANPERDPWMYIDYTPGCLDSLGFGGLDTGIYQVLACFQKTEQSTWQRIPVQFRYQGAWSK